MNKSIIGLYQLPRELSKESLNLFKEHSLNHRPSEQINYVFN